jgi:hypothetical protein
MALHEPPPVGRCRHAGWLCGEVSLAAAREYDRAYTKARLIAAPRQVGETHPFIVGTDGVQRYFTVMSECATASKPRAGAK